MVANKEYKIYSQNNFRKIPQISALTEEMKLNIDVVSRVLPFKVNNYLIDELIDDMPLPPAPEARLRPARPRAFLAWTWVAAVEPPGVDRPLTERKGAIGHDQIQIEFQDRPKPVAFRAGAVW